MMEEKAQASLELLLIVGGAIIIVTAVAVFIKSIASSTTEAAQTEAEGTLEQP